MTLTQPECKFYLKALMGIVEDAEKVSAELECYSWDRKPADGEDKLTHYKTFKTTIKVKGNNPDVLITSANALPILAVNDDFTASEDTNMILSIYHGGYLGNIAVYVCPELEPFTFITFSINEEGNINNLKRGIINR